MFVASCAPARSETSEPESAARPLHDAPACTVSAANDAPYIVEWPAADRATLEVMVSQGLVPIAYDGCEVRLQSKCRVRAARYRYRPFTARKAETIEVVGADELYTRLPLGAARLERALARSSGLTVAMDQVGRHESNQDHITAGQLVGDCDDVTHLIWGMTVGAHEVSTVGHAASRSQARIASAVAGFDRHRDREVWASDGVREACAVATPRDKRPPSRCGAILRVEVVELHDGPPTLDRLAYDDLAEGFAPHLVAARACAAVHETRPHERVHLELTISADTGLIEHVAAVHKFVGTPLGACVADAVRGAEFPLYRNHREPLYRYSIRMGDPEVAVRQ